MVGFLKHSEYYINIGLDKRKFCNIQTEFVKITHALGKLSINLVDKTTFYINLLSLMYYLYPQDEVYVF